MHDGRVTVRPSVTARRARVLLVSVASLGILLFGIVTMHARMASHDTFPSDTMGAAAMGSHAGNVEAAITVRAAMVVIQHGMGGMAAMDCLVLGMTCLFGAVALLLLLALMGRLRALLRRRLAVRALAAVGSQRSPAPTSLLVLSISRT
jgi:hypothetical protein